MGRGRGLVGGELGVVVRGAVSTDESVDGGESGEDGRGE